MTFVNLWTHDWLMIACNIHTYNITFVGAMGSLGHRNLTLWIGNRPELPTKSNLKKCKKKCSFNNTCCCSHTLKKTQLCSRPCSRAIVAAVITTQIWSCSAAACCTLLSAHQIRRPVAVYAAPYACTNSAGHFPGCFWSLRGGQSHSPQPQSDDSLSP